MRGELRLRVGKDRPGRVRPHCGPYHKSDRVPAGWPTTVVSYGSDLPFLGSWGECYQLGPGTIRVAHSDAEHIRKDDLLRGVDLYVRLATDLLGGEAA